LITEIDAAPERCFDASRDINVHQRSAAGTGERAICGRTAGLCELGDTVTGEARHFGITQRLTVQISRFERPHFFEDTMLNGAFKHMRHEHHFKEKDGKTIMTDRFEYETPYGIIGAVFDKLVLKRHMTNFLLTLKYIKAVVQEVKSKPDVGNLFKV
jgi:hypothetical protein